MSMIIEIIKTFHSFSPKKDDPANDCLDILIITPTKVSIKKNNKKTKTYCRKSFKQKMKIKGKKYRTIWFDNNVVKIIDQTKLPHQFIIKDLKTVEDQLMQSKQW